MENLKTFKTPCKTLARMQVVHFGKILFNLQFIAVAVMVASVISFILPAFYYILLFCIATLTLYTLFLDPTFRAMWAGGETLTKIAEAMTHSWKFTVPIAIIFAITSIVCLCFDKHQKHIARIVVSSIICVLALILLFFKLVNTGVIK